MSGRILTDDLIKEFKQYLNQEEKSGITVEKYLRDVEAFRKYANMQEVTKELVVSYKKHLNELGMPYAASILCLPLSIVF